MSGSVELGRAARVLRDRPDAPLSSEVVPAVAAWLDSEASNAAITERCGYEVGPRFPGLVLARLLNREA